MSVSANASRGEAIPRNSSRRGQTKTSEMLGKRGRDRRISETESGILRMGRPQLQSFGATEARVMLLPLVDIPQPMPRHQNEADKACTPYIALRPGTSQGAGHDRRDNGVVGVGARDQELAAAGPQVSGGFSSARLPREAHRRWTYLLPPEPVTRATQDRFTEMNGGMRR